MRHFLLVLLLYLPVGGLASGDEPEPELDLRRSIKDFVSSDFIHGVTYHEAHAFGPRAVPILKEFLTDETLYRYRSNIVVTIALIGDAQGFEILRTFIWDPLEGPVDVATFQAIISAQHAMGFIKSSETVPYLKRGCDPATWGGLRWSHKRKDLPRTLSDASIQSLSWTGDPKARQFLKQLEARPYYPEQRASIGYAIERFDMIQVMGIEEYQRYGYHLQMQKHIVPRKPAVMDSVSHKGK